MGRTLQLSQCLGTCKFIARDHLTWVETHDEQTLCPFEQLSGKNQYCVGGVSHLSQWLALTATDQTNVKLTSVSCACEAITSSFAAGCTTSISRTMVAASEVTNSLPKWLITSLFRPVAPSVDTSLSPMIGRSRTIWTKTCSDKV